MILLPPPPKQNASPKEWEQWHEKLYKAVRPNFQALGQGNHNIGEGISHVFVTVTSAPQTKTLPPTKNVHDGDTVTIEDRAGGAAAQNITIAPNGTDTIVGILSINSNYGRWVGVKYGTQWLGRLI